MAPRKPTMYGDLTTIEKLQKLEWYLHCLVVSDKTADHTKTIIVAQLVKIAKQLEELAPSPVEAGDPIEALRLRVIG